MKRQVRIVQVVEVEIDEAKFTPEFMSEFRAYLYHFQTIDEHIEHLGQLYARGLHGGSSDDFIEGYGSMGDMGIGFASLSLEEEIVEGETE